MFGAPDGITHYNELLGQPFETGLLDNQNGNTELLQLLTLTARHTVRPEQHEIRAQAEQGFHLHLAIASNRRHRLQRRWALATIQDANQPVGSIEFEHDLAKRWRQAHYSLGSQRRQ